MFKKFLVVITSILGLFALVGYITTKKMADELAAYKEKKMEDITTRIVNASLKNLNLDLTRKEDAEKVLNFYEDKMNAARTKQEFDINYEKLNQLIEDFTVESTISCNIAVIEAMDEINK